MRVLVDLALVRAFSMTVRAHARSAQRLPRVLAHVPIVPGDAQDSRRRDDLPVGRAVEDIAHTSDDREMATIEDFQKIEMRVGRVVAVEDFPAARNPSYKLTNEFGALGERNDCEPST